VDKHVLIEQNSIEWQLIEGYLLDRLKTLREKNDNSLTEMETQNLRGSIKEIKALLKLPDRLNNAGMRKSATLNYLP